MYRKVLGPWYWVPSAMVTAYTAYLIVDNWAFLGRWFEMPFGLLMAALLYVVIVGSQKRPKRLCSVSTALAIAAVLLPFVARPQFIPPSVCLLSVACATALLALGVEDGGWWAGVVAVWSGIMACLGWLLPYFVAKALT